MKRPQLPVAMLHARLAEEQLSCRALVIGVDEQDAMTCLREKLGYRNSVRRLRDTTLDIDEHQHGHGNNLPTLIIPESAYSPGKCTPLLLVRALSKGNSQ
jgi:hypothetical protein